LPEWERPKVQEADGLKTLSTEMGFKEHLGFGVDENCISTREHSGTFHFTQKFMDSSAMREPSSRNVKPLVSVSV